MDTAHKGLLQRRRKGRSMVLRERAAIAYLRTKEARRKRAKEALPALLLHLVDCAVAAGLIMVTVALLALALVAATTM